MPIDNELAKAARKAVTFAPVPQPRPKNWGKTRDDWRKHQDAEPNGAHYLPSEKFIYVDKERGWDYYSPFQKDGQVKPGQDLREIAGKLASFKEKAWLIKGETGKDGTRPIIAVVLDGSENGSPYLLIAADKPGLHVTIDGTQKRIQFKGAKLVENIDGTVTEGDSLAMEKLVPLTLRCHDKGGTCAVRNTDQAQPLKVKIKGECQVEKCKEAVFGEITQNGDPVDMKPPAEKPQVEPGRRR